MHAFVFVVAGIASWFYPAGMYGSQRVCAMNIVRPGRRVLVVNAANGDQAICTVIGTGPFVRGRVIDLSPSMRDAIHLHGLGPVRVYIEQHTPSPRGGRL